MLFNFTIGARVDSTAQPPWLIPKGVAKVGLCSAIYSCSNGEVEKHICGFKCMTIRPLHVDITLKFFTLIMLKVPCDIMIAMTVDQSFSFLSNFNSIPIARTS